MQRPYKVRRLISIYRWHWKQSPTKYPRTPVNHLSGLNTLRREDKGVRSVHIFLKISHEISMYKFRNLIPSVPFSSKEKGKILVRIFPSPHRRGDKGVRFCYFSEDWNRFQIMFWILTMAIRKQDISPDLFCAVEIKGGYLLRNSYIKRLNSFAEENRSDKNI